MADSQRRIDEKSSQTAAWTCVSRAASYLERDPLLHSDDDVALELVPRPIKMLLHSTWLRRLFTQRVAPAGIYEYVITRTKAIDDALLAALDDGIEQVLIMGAGFDSRALRFADRAGGARFFELDAPTTQGSKIAQYRKRGLAVPPNLVWVPIDFDKQSLPERLDAVGFRRGARSLFLLEGLIMYLEAESVDATFRVIADYAGGGSRVVFDAVYADVIRGEGRRYGERDAAGRVSGAGESWRFGIEEGGVADFLAPYGFRVEWLRDASALEAEYLTAADGRVAGRVNGTHLLVGAVVPEP